MGPRPTRGFRLHELRLYYGQKRDEVPFVTKDSNYAQHLENIAGAHLLHKKFAKPPRLDYFSHAAGPAEDDEDGDEDEPPVIFHVQDVKRDGRRVQIKYRAGNVGAYSHAVSPEADEVDVDMRGRAAVNEQRAWFLLPSEGGKVGLLVAESAGRAAGEESLRRWLHAASRAERNPEPHWRLGMKAVSDPEHVNSLINEEAMREVVLLRREEQLDRSTSVVQFTIRSPLKTEYSRRKFANIVRRWFEQPDTLTVREGASELAAIIHPGFKDVPFDDGYVRAKGDDSPQQLRPDLARDIFTYSLGPGWLDDLDVLKKAQEVASRIQELSDLEVPWP